MAMTGAERAARARAKRKDGAAPVRYRRPKDRRSRVDRWRDAVRELDALLMEYEGWRDALPAPLAFSLLAEKLDSVLELRALVEALEAAELPRGFGRD